MVAVASDAHLWDVELLEGEIAVVVGGPAAGKRVEDVEDEVQMSGLGVVAARITPVDERWTYLGPSFSCRNPVRDHFI